jgi:hypothetical protein
MIVIASHDDMKLLEQMLQRLTEIDLNGHEVLIVDTNSTSKEYLDTVEKFKVEYPNFKFDRKEYTCWDTGAYLHAYKNYPAETYIFLQDSLYITNPKLIDKIDLNLEVHEVVGIFNFKYLYYNEKELYYAEEGLTPYITSFPNDGIFGPIFAVHRSTLDKIPKDWFREPTCKEQGCGMERRWSLMFHLIGASKKYIEHFLSDGAHQPFWDQHPSTQTEVRKIWVNRK